jgi:hypothetical protein
MRLALLPNISSCKFFVPLAWRKGEAIAFKGRRAQVLRRKQDRFGLGQSKIFFFMSKLWFIFGL